MSTDDLQNASAEELLNDSFFARKADGGGPIGEPRVKIYYGTGQNNGYVSARVIEKFDLDKWDRVYITHENKRGNGLDRFDVGDEGFVIIFAKDKDLPFGSKLNQDGTTYQFYGNGMAQDLNLDLPVEFELIEVESNGQSCSLYAKLINQGMCEN